MLCAGRDRKSGNTLFWATDGMRARLGANRFSTDDFSESSTESSVEPGDWTYVDIDTFEANVDEFEAAF
jgi:hypothetical protein